MSKLARAMAVLVLENEQLREDYDLLVSRPMALGGPGTVVAYQSDRAGLVCDSAAYIRKLETELAEAMRSCDLLDNVAMGERLGWK